MSYTVPLTITPATDTQKTNAYRLPHDIKGLLVHVPTLDAPADTAQLEVYMGAPPLPDDSTNAVLLATYNTDWAEVSDVLSVGGGDISAVPVDWALGGYWVRVVTSAAQDATTFKLIF